MTDNKNSMIDSDFLQKTFSILPQLLMKIGFKGNVPFLELYSRIHLYSRQTCEEKTQCEQMSLCYDRDEVARTLPCRCDREHDVPVIMKKTTS